MDDDDLDLGAWQPPPPPPGIADAVLVRMHRPPIATPVEVTRRPRKWWVIGGLAVGLAMTSLTAAIVSDMTDHVALSNELRHSHDEVTRLHDELAASKEELENAKVKAFVEQERSRLQADTEIRELKEQLALPAGAPKPADVPKPVDPPKPAKPADPPKPADAPCDATAAKASGERAMTQGNYAVALTAFERSLACKPDDQVERLAYVSACDAKNVMKAFVHYSRLPVAIRDGARQICVRNGIMLEDLPAPPPCDADALRKAGDDSAMAGLDAKALSAYERAYACRPDAHLVKVLFMESCKSKNVEKVHKYWKMVAPADRGTIRVICVRNGITDEL